MRLLNTKTLTLQDFPPGQEPQYSILSHTWGSREVTYEDIVANGGRLPSTDAASKIRNFCQKASCTTGIINTPVSWVWVDTCCINKSSSAELQEAINSMFRWYKSAAECMVYLEDVQVGSWWDRDLSLEELGATWKEISPKFKRARWLTRGWTLQELIASKKVIFYDRDWIYLGEFGLSHLTDALADATGIPTSIMGYYGIHHESFAKSKLRDRVKWARNRQTTRPEDRSYSLLGVLDVSMPMIYGEGAEKAFKRLKREVKEEHGIELSFEGLY